MSTTPAPDRWRALVVSDHALVAETVRSALDNRGFEMVEGPPADVGLLLCDLDRWSGIREAAAIVGRHGVPWVALASSARGAPWGALLAAGAATVVPVETSLVELGDLLLAVARGEVATPADERRELVEAWDALRARHLEVTRRVRLLAQHEVEVLRLLRDGSPVGTIAELMEISPRTVRERVEAVQRKLAVASPAAAVEVFLESLDPIDA